MKFIAALVALVALIPLQAEQAPPTVPTMPTASGTSPYAAPLPPADEWTLAQRFSYLWAMSELPRVVQQQGMDPRAIILGLEDLIARNDSKVDLELAQGIVNEYQKQLADKMQQQVGMMKAANERHMAQVAQQDGMVSTESGLVYRVIKPGTGPKPTANSKVRVNYTGRFINGRVFDSTAQRDGPAILSPSGVIPGWSEALQLMSVGAKWELHIPWNLAYGERGRQGAVPPYSTLIFELELLGIE